MFYVTEIPFAPKGDGEDSGAEPYIAVVMLLLISFGNGLVILSVYINPMLREWTYYFIINLAVSDLSTVGCCLCAVITTSARNLISTGVQCVMAYGPYIFATSSSAFALIISSFDRYLLICWPLKYADLVRPARAAMAIALGWIFAALITAIPLLLPQTYTMSGLCLVQKIWPLSYVLAVLVIVYLLPLLSISAMYINIALVVLRHRREIQALQPQPLSSVATVQETVNSQPNQIAPEPGPPNRDNSASKDSHMSKGGWKMTKMVLIVSGYYTLSWLPFFWNLIVLVKQGK